MSLLKKISLAAVIAAAPFCVQAGELGKDLTPLGAIKAGNANGTIPAWTGGVTKAPAGYKAGGHHVDPFASDKPMFKIDSTNVSQYKDKLSPGQVEMLEKYTDYYMTIYPTRRSASYPQYVYDASMKNDKTSSLINDGNGVTGASIASPFPKPKNGLEAIWNHLLRFRGESTKQHIGQVNPTSDGNYTMIKFDQSAIFPYAKGDVSDNKIAYFKQEILAPARLSGEVLLVHETLDQVKEPRQAWTYNPGQRRVRRAPNIAYDNPGTASDGLRTTDQLDIFNGAPDMYDWTLKGRKEMYVPYNDYKLHADGIAYDDIIKAGHLNPELLRFELHRVWEVEATLKAGKSNIYSKRVFYIDEDSWQIMVADHYDGRGDLWRVGEAFGINYYDYPLYWSTIDAIYDLQSGRYTAIGFDNNEPMYVFDSNLSTGDFTPDALRRKTKR